ncbi:YciI family protein [Truepera radiovictrix]|uniref:YCII-related protein n=1 Tax=Truepera radiovictrix (strain DSM 17093 / CIP 108686 / LMG 22925 / RQ-24) TaxID=649638 RepID=D7CWR2_TRURR|nr:YciI family protein [Truepera radiovictrix]ADI13153.1 YCII-related protein [Truepera radiovictrix DSM 17093]WMT58277.1 YciI family protein [Truepera radiovictrix]
MTFLVIAKDGTDPDAPARRQRARQRHLDEIRPAVDAGRVRLGGALLDGAGTMIGSALLLEAPSLEAARELLENDVYFKEGVWQQLEIYPFRRAVGLEL